MLKRGCFVICFLLVVVIEVSAHEKKKEKETYPPDWQMQSRSDQGYYGAEINKAYNFLKDRQPKRKVVVAVIDGGIDVSHEDLKGNLWTNKGEIPGNGIDDDGNGYADDIHGWNFLGTKDGKQVTLTALDADYEFMRLREKFDGVDTNKLSGKELKLYHYYTREVIPVSPLGKAYKGIETGRMLVEYAERFDREMRAKFPGEKLDRTHYMAIIDKNEKDEKRKQAHFYYLLGWASAKNAPWELIFEVRKKIVPQMEKLYEKELKRVEQDQRAEVGDNMNDIHDRFYGNANLLGNNSNHGTHVAGIIGAVRSNSIGMDGVAADVELMILRVLDGKGDERDKDVANAIRYAVENGANIINMSFGKSFSSGKKWVDDAMKYAEKRGVLLVHAAGNSNACIDEMPVYPVKNISKKKSLKNFITVGSIAPDGNPAISSNYGKANVDLFAPGVDIYSTIVGGNYKKMGGTSMAAPVVSGVAALVWSYFPELSVQELKEVLMNGVSSRKGEQVQKPQSRMLATPRSLVNFEELCVSGGILNALQSVQLAEEIVNKK